MSFSLSPILNGYSNLGTSGLPLNAGQIFTYAAGTTTPAATYTTSLGNVQNANPIILNPDGRAPQEIWLQDGLSYKFVIEDSLNNVIFTYDNIQSLGTLIQNFVNTTTFLTSADGRYPIYVGTAGGTADALTAVVATNITALYNGMIVSVDAIAANATATPTFTLTLGSTVTSTLTIVDYNLQPLQGGAIAGLGHKILLGYNSLQSKWVLINPQPVVASAGTVSRRQTALIGPVDITGMPSFLPQTATGLTLTTQNIAGVETVQTATATFTNGSAVIGWAGNTLVANQAVSFTTTGGLPTNFVVGTTYYVSSTGLSGTQFEVAATPGGTPISAGSAGTGVQTAWAGVQLPLTGTSYFGNDGVTGELNVVGQATSNFSFPALTNNATNYLYSTVSTLGVFTHAVTTLAPVVVYGPTTSPSITSGQITIDVVRCEVYLGNGAAAVETTLVVWGTATTSGGNITATQTYNYGKPPTFSGKSSGTLLRRTVYSTAATFTWIKSPQTTGINVKVKGGGGAGASGGGTAAAAASIGGGGGGGGGGGYAEGIFDASAFNTVTVTLASAGSSSFGSLISATAGSTGSGGQGSPAGSEWGVGGPGGSGGAGTGGDIQITGQTGSTGGSAGNIASGPGGTGGDTGAGKGGAGISSSGNGNVGSAGVFGGGGGGGSGGFSNGAVQTGGAGGAGSVGYIIVEEYM